MPKISIFVLLLTLHSLTEGIGLSLVSPGGEIDVTVNV
jgi:hypothetical protein